MQVIKKRKLWYQSGNLIMSIPREVIRHFKLEPGDEVDTYCFDNKLIIDLNTAGKPKPFVTPAEVEAA
jgi:hypothetical protein